MCFLLLSGAIPKGLRSINGSLSSLVAEVKLTPYYNWMLHIDGALTIFGHVLRCINNLLHVAGYLAMSVPILFLSPLELPLLPLAIGQHLAAAAISAFTAVIQPVIWTLRTVLSLFLGYMENSDCYGNTEQEEQDDWDLAINPFIPSAN